MRIVLLTALTKASMAHSPALVITMVKKFCLYLRYENIGFQVKLNSNEKSIRAKIMQHSVLIMNGLYFYSILGKPLGWIRTKLRI